VQTDIRGDRRPPALGKFSLGTSHTRAHDATPSPAANAIRSTHFSVAAAAPFYLRCRHRFSGPSTIHGGSGIAPFRTQPSL